jgi:hypothetical protein
MASDETAKDARMGISERLANLGERGKPPNSTCVLDSWIAKAQPDLGVESSRLRWLIASSVVIAALQRAVDEFDEPLFLLKGGTYLQHRLNWEGRPTKDVDGLVRGDIKEFLVHLDHALTLAWGPLTFSRTEVETIQTPDRVIKPCRFQVKASVKGVVWCSVKVEIASDEAGAGLEQERVAAPQLKHFGLETPEHLATIALRWQIAQKLHASSDPHEPPGYVNDRVRDVPDLILLRRLTELEGTPSLSQQRLACEALFKARALDAQALGRDIRTWPCRIVAHEHWNAGYPKAAQDAGLNLSLTDAVVNVNEWITEIQGSP